MLLKIIQKTYICFALASLLTIATTSACSTQIASSSHPTDQALEKKFRENKNNFGDLVEMSSQDSKVVRIAHDFTWLENNVDWPRPVSELGFSEDRWNEYRKVFKNLGLTKGLMRYPESGTLLLTASSEGLLTGGSSKGYAYSEKELPTVSGSLDDYERSSPKKNRPAYKQIDKNWYLYYDFE